MIERTVQMSERPGWAVKPRSRRIAEFSIADGMLLRLFQPGLTYRVERDHLPADARLVGVEYDIMRGAWRCFIESETFAEVPEGQTPPPVPAPTLYVEVIGAEPEGDEMAHTSTRRI